MQDIHNNSVILAPAILHGVIRKELLMKKKGRIGISLQTIEGYFLSFVSHPPQSDEVLFQYRESLQKHLKQFPIYQHLCLKEYFLIECRNLLDDLKFYDVSLSSLPQTTDEEKEKALILSILYPIPTKIDFLKKSLSFIRKDNAVYIYPAFFSDKEAYLCNILLENGALLLAEETQAPKTSFYHAMNMREEVEGMAQYIITHDINAEDVNITVCTPSYQPLIEQIFTRYHLPFTLLSKTTQNLSAKKFHALIMYYLIPNKNNFLALLANGFFMESNPFSLKEYLELFQSDIHDTIKELPTVESELISAYEVEKLQQLRDKAKTSQAVILPLLSALEALPWKEALLQISDLVAQYTTSEERNNFLQVQQYLQLAFPYLHQKEDLFMLCEHLKKRKAQKKETVLQGALVQPLNIILPPRKHHFLLGTTQSNYPAFPLKKGIFDETYYAKTELPTMQKRYDAYLSQLHKQETSSSFFIVSYPLGDYEGKPFEASFEIETMMKKKAIAYPLEYHYQTYDPKIVLSSAQAHDIYLKKNILYGSISSLERFRKCPFSYFLRYGLRLKEPFQPTFDESKTGTLAHHVLEIITKTYGKEYVRVQSDKIEELLANELQALLTIFPKRKNWSYLLQQRLLMNIQQNLKVLKEMEEHSVVSIFKSEYEFYHDYQIADTTLRLHGFIDRIDSKNEYLRIIDYKSSPKSLQESQVFAALQLQLITYSIVAKHDFQKKVLGAYYVSLKNESIPYQAGKMKRRPVEYVRLNDGDYVDAVYRAHRMQGWNMDPHLDMMDDSGTHIIGLTMHKSGEVTSRKYYNLDVLEQHFQKIYETLAQQILSGTIAIAPDESACQYCKYHEICRFKGYPVKKEPFVDVDESIYLE